jgi:hypothetical protein
MEAMDRPAEVGDLFGHLGPVLQARGRWFEPNCAHDEKEQVPEAAPTPGSMSYRGSS